MSINIYKKTSPESYLIIINKPNHDDPICGYFGLYNYCFSNKGKELSVKVFINTYAENKLSLSNELQDVSLSFSFDYNFAYDMVYKCLNILETEYTKNKHFKDARESLDLALNEIIFPDTTKAIATDDDPHLFFGWKQKEKI